jgi:hypothetical protein
MGMTSGLKNKRWKRKKKLYSGLVKGFVLRETYGYRLSHIVVEPFLKSSSKFSSHSFVNSFQANSN